MQLEALRGIAALVVVAWHFLWAFDPGRLGIVQGFDSAKGLVGSVALAAIDGPAAVMLFFVLSGFVLPLGYFRSGSTEVVTRAAAKRWFRLVGLSFLATLLSYLLFRFGLYHHRDAAEFTQSAWLGTFGGSHPESGFVPSLRGAMTEGIFLAFLREPDSYVPMLWTMHHEFIGSFVTFFLALMIWRAHFAVALWFLASATVVAQYTDPWLLGFIMGTGLAWLVSRYGVRLPGVMAFMCIGLGVFLFGYLEPTGAYALFATLHDSGTAVRYDRIGVHTASGMLIILGLLCNESLSVLLTAPVSRFLGRISFPVYLFHFPLLCSLACGLFIVLRPAMSHGATLVIVAIAYGASVFVIGYLFARVDEMWLRWINFFADSWNGSIQLRVLSHNDHTTHPKQQHHRVSRPDEGIQNP